MKINRNMLAVGTNQHLLRNENKLSISMERLSSGYKINRAGDNPAGLAISHKMKAQIDGLNQAKSNTTDAQSVLRIADGALNEASSMLQRIRELCVQAANDTNSLDERTAIQDEIDKLTEEIDRISSDTEYNTKTLLDGSSDLLVVSKQTERMYISDSVLPEDYSMEVTQAAEKAEYSIAGQPAAPGVFSINGIEMEVTDGMTEPEFYAALRDTAERAGCVATRDGNGYNLVSNEYGQSAGIEFKVVVHEGITTEQMQNLAADLGLMERVPVSRVDEDGNPVEDENGNQIIDIVVQPLADTSVTTDENGNTVAISSVERGVDAEVELGAGFNATATAYVDGLRVVVTDLSGFCMDFSIKEDVNTAADTAINDPDVDENTAVDIRVTDIGAMTIQMGANQYQDMDIRIPSVSAKSLYLDKVDVTITGGPDRALGTLDKAIDRLNDVRSRIGAFTNRLEYAERSLDEAGEDMTSAYSNILDTDMAGEMVEYTQQNVLEQASISVLAQANDLPSQVLSLLQR